MAFDLNNLNPTHQFFYGDDRSEWVNLREIPDAKYTEFRKSLGIKQKRVKEFDKNGQPVFINDFNIDDEKLAELSDMVNDYMIESWHLETNDGEEIPCDIETKKKMMSECPPFSAWIESCVKEMKTDKEEAREKEEKN